MAGSWFKFIESLVPASDAEMTSLVMDGLAGGSATPLRLDWLVPVGGRLRADLETAIAQLPASKLIIRAAMTSDPVLDFEIEAWLKERPNRKLEWNKTEAGATATLRHWYEALNLPAELQQHIAEFLEDVRVSRIDMNEPPWLFWGRFLPWLKRRAGKDGESERRVMLPAIQWADERLTFLRVALSPQDETGERASLQPQTLLMNPTFEYVEGRGVNGAIVAFARQWDAVVKRTLTALEASILDQVRESFRIDRQDLLKHIVNETGVQKEFVGVAVDSLVEDFFLLGKTTDQSSRIDQ